MKRSSCLFAALCRSARAAVQPIPRRRQSDCAQIVARNITARGGLSAWRAIHTLTMAASLKPAQSATRRRS